MWMHQLLGLCMAAAPGELPTFLVAEMLGDSEHLAVVRSPLAPLEKIRRVEQHRRRVKELRLLLRGEDASAVSEWSIQKTIWQDEFAGDLAGEFKAALGADAHVDAIRWIREKAPIVALFDKGMAEKLELSEMQVAAASAALRSAETLPKDLNWSARSSVIGGKLVAVLTMSQRRSLQAFAGLENRVPKAPSSPLMASDSALAKLVAIPLVRERMKLSPTALAGVLAAQHDWHAEVAEEHRRFKADKSFFDIPEYTQRLGSADEKFERRCGEALGDAEKQRLKEIHFQTFAVHRAYSDAGLRKELGITAEQATQANEEIKKKLRGNGRENPFAAIAAAEIVRANILTPRQKALLAARSGRLEPPAFLFAVRMEYARLNRPIAWKSHGPRVSVGKNEILGGAMP